jgi:hypothetical protein
MGVHEGTNARLPFLQIVSLWPNTEHPEPRTQHKSRTSNNLNYRRTMGNLLSTTLEAGISSMAITEIKAPASVVWECIADLEAAPRIIGMVGSVTMERGKRNPDKEDNDKFCVGTRWKETRVYHGMELIQQKTITALSECEDPASPSYSVCIAVNYSMKQDFTNTSTLTVAPLTETTSTLVGTFATRYGICTRLFFLATCGPCRFQDVKLMFQTEMDEYGAEAEKRYQATLTSEGDST